MQGLQGRRGAGVKLRQTGRQEPGSLPPVKGSNASIFPLTYRSTIASILSCLLGWLHRLQLRFVYVITSSTKVQLHCKDLRQVQHERAKLQQGKNATHAEAGNLTSLRVWSQV